MISEAFSVLAGPGHSADKTRTARAVVRRAERATLARADEPLRATLGRAARTVRDMLAARPAEPVEPVEIDEALVHLELFVASCRTMLAGVMDVPNFERPAAHALFSLVESSLLTHALRDLKAASPGAGEPRRHEVEAVRSFARHLHVDDAARQACSIALALAERPVERLAELAGFAYAGAFVLAVLSTGPARPRHRTALATVVQALDGLDGDRVARGARMFALCVSSLAGASARTPARRAGRAIRMLEHKARYAMLHHGKEQLGDRRLVEWFSDKPFRAAAVLDALYRSPWIDRDDVAASPFFQSLTARGGKMYGVFSPAELALLQQHLIDRSHGAAQIDAAPHPAGPDGDLGEADLRDDDPGDGSVPGGGAAPRGGRRDAAPVVTDVAPHDYRGRYFALLDAEHHPGAMRAAADALAETFGELAALRKARAGTPLFEPLGYDRAAVEARISEIYWYQAERARGMQLALDGDALRRFHLCFAPLGLVDGCWLRSAVADRSSDAHLLLYGVYSDEIGNGEHAHNHANLYGRLLAELGCPIASVNDPALRAADLPRRAFKAPAFLLALDRVHAGHFPELLGVTLAIEMSGLDGLYERMIATLESRGHSAAYWRLHVSVDNYSTGHARQSLDAVLAYMDDAVAGLGAAAAAPLWDRIWRGFLVMLYLFEIELQVLSAAAGATGARA